MKNPYCRQFVGSIFLNDFYYYCTFRHHTDLDFVLLAMYSIASCKSKNAPIFPSELIAGHANPRLSIKNDYITTLQPRLCNMKKNTCFILCKLYVNYYITGYSHLQIREVRAEQLTDVFSLFTFYLSTVLISCVYRTLFLFEKKVAHIQASH